MSKIGFSKDTNDFNGLPYYGVKLTSEEAKIVKNKEMGFLVIDGNKMFKIKDEKGNETGEYMLFVIWK